MSVVDMIAVVEQGYADQQTGRNVDAEHRLREEQNEVNCMETVLQEKIDALSTKIDSIR